MRQGTSRRCSLGAVGLLSILLHAAVPGKYGFPDPALRDWLGDGGEKDAVLQKWGLGVMGS